MSPDADDSKLTVSREDKPRRRSASIPQMVLTMLTGLALTLGRALMSAPARFRYLLKARPLASAVTGSVVSLGILGAIMVAAIASHPTIATGPLLPGTAISPVRVVPRNASAQPSRLHPARRVIAPLASTPSIAPSRSSPFATPSRSTPSTAPPSPAPSPPGSGSRGPAPQPSPSASSPGPRPSPSPSPSGGTSGGRPRRCLIYLLGLCIL